MRNLFRAEEIYLIADAISAMLFTLEFSNETIIVRFEGRESFRLDRVNKIVLLTARSGIPEPVYTFKWWKITDFMMWRAIEKSVEFYNENIHRIRMQDYRAFFGNHLGEVCAETMELVEKAEGEARQLARMDRTRGGNDLHPDVARMIQKDPDEPYVGQQMDDEPEESKS